MTVRIVMHTDLPLLTTLAVSLTAAFIFGFLACKIGLSPIVGYLIAGVVTGPHTPGLIADPSMAQELAEIGVLLLMFGIGLHFSLRDLLDVKYIAVPGALVQILVITALGTAISQQWGWTLPASLLFGLSLSVASTVLILREFRSANLLDTEAGRVAVGWLIVEDMVMVLVLVLIPVFLLQDSGGEISLPPAEIWVPAVGIALGKILLFILFMVFVGGRVMTWILHLILHTGSRELFTLSVFAIAIGIAFAAAKLFNISYALGAFFAGMMLRESTLSIAIAKKSQPFQDVFTAMFFASVGMLFDPSILVNAPLRTLITVAIIMLGNMAVVFCILKLFRFQKETVWLIAAGLAQIGEFSFILANMGLHAGILPQEAYGLILAGALITMIVSPFLFDQVWRRVQILRRLSA